MKRRFEVVSTYTNVVLPTRATRHSAGYDLHAVKETTIEPKQMGLVATGVKAFFPANESLLIYARSSLPVKYGLLLPNGVGVVDSDYVNNETNEGELLVLLYNFTDYTVVIPKNERIAQAIFTPFQTVDDEATPSSSRTGGFGSTT
jgi:deoxyuridine 5''-triphosphate nucleotidohydrolase (dut)